MQRPVKQSEILRALRCKCLWFVSVSWSNKGGCILSRCGCLESSLQKPVFAERSEAREAGDDVSESQLKLFDL